MRLPRGRLVRQRVVTDAATPLAAALDEGLTGYARLESQDSLLLDGEGSGVVTFEGGIPVAAYHTGTDSTGAGALEDIAVAGPYRLELFELDADRLAPVHETPELEVPPGMPAERLAADPTLADRTRKAAPTERLQSQSSDEESKTEALEAFLDDEERIDSIRERARVEAQRRADEWDL